MNYGLNQAMPNQSRAYQAAQESLHPISESLQVDSSMEALRGAVELNSEIVHALLRRLEPVTGDVAVLEEKYGGVTIQKVPLARSIDAQREQIEGLTSALRLAINALQI